MIRADLHVHSKYSSASNDWMMKRVGAIESYSEPEDVYRIARRRGMHFVTLTDHNTMDGVLRLRDRHPDDVFTGVEVTASFPEDGCKVHILLYGIEETDWREINAARSNIYELRDMIRDRHFAHSVAHGVYSVNRKLTVAHLEKLIVLFDVFEGLNAGRNRFNSERWRFVLESLTSDRVSYLAEKHGLEPFSNGSWIKGFTAGSDDHSSIFVGRAYTECRSADVTGFVDMIRRKKTTMGGTPNTYRDLALSIYKISHDYAKSRDDRNKRKSFFHTINELVFNDKPIGWKNRLFLYRLRYFSRRKQLWSRIGQMISQFDAVRGRPVMEKRDLIETSIDRLADTLLGESFSYIETAGRSFRPGDLMKAVQSLMTGSSVVMPYMAAIKDLYKSRNVIDGITESVVKKKQVHRQKILWISDTFDHLNGVSVTMRNVLERVANSNFYDVNAMVSVPDSSIPDRLQDKVLNIPAIHEYTPGFYNTVTVRFPSLIRSIDAIEQFQPDKIVISTPGPLGMIGLIAAKLLEIPATAIYHTDFTFQAVKMMGDTFITECIEKYMRFFYNLSDFIKVPTYNYIEILKNRNFDSSRMSLLGRAVDCARFSVQSGAAARLAEQYGIKDGFTFLYAGRVSEDKNIRFIGDIYLELLKRFPALNLVIAGDGPDLEAFRSRMKNQDRVVFTGRLSQVQMPLLYSGSDALLFPSVTDTFGMVVLEAHACGLPALVSDMGGPCEIVEDGHTGYVITADHLNRWVETASRLIVMKERRPSQFQQLKLNARKHVENSFSWEQNLRDLFDSSQKSRECDSDTDSPVIFSKTPTGIRIPTAA